MTTPSIVSSKYAGTSADFLKAKIDRSGACRNEYFTVTVPGSTSTSTVIGLVPFRKGARFVQGASQLYTADLDTGTDVTIDIGYVYDDNVTYTNDPDAFASALTTAQTGGLITFDEFAGLSWQADGDGWIAITTGGGSTTTSGAIKGQIVLAYD